MNELAPIKHPDLSILDANIGAASPEGDLLRFNGTTGIYSIGQEKEPLSLGTLLRVHPLSTIDGYQSWEGGKLEGEVFRSWATDPQPVSREELGNLDEALWRDGKDPWKFTTQCAFRKMTGPLLRFSTQSWGGHNAIKKLMKAYRFQRDGYDPRLVPVVELGAESYINKDHGNKIWVPVFTIMDWQSWDGKPLPKLEAPTVSTSEVLDDEIPF